MKVKHLLLSAALVSVTAMPLSYAAKKTSNSVLESITSVERDLDARFAQVEDQVESLLSQMTLDEKISLTHANSKFAVASIERLGIHEMWMSDGPHGVRHEIARDSWDSAGWTDDHSTYLPPLTTVAASWNREVAALHGNVLGSEARHRRKDLILGPGVNLARLPLNGRNFEYMGEDPYLAGKLSVAEIKAIQANDVAATIKHYALNTQELNRKDVDARPDERTLREVYLPAFEMAVKEANVYSVMGAYNSYYGTNANQSKHLVMDILKGEWGFDGVLITDWNVMINTYDAAMNGLDVEMGTGVDSYDDFYLADPLKKMILDGKVPMSVLDDKVRRVLRLQLRIGMMDKARLSGQRNTQEHRAAARRIAEEGIVLLKNDRQVLPLDKTKLKNVLVIGPNADKKHASTGGSSQVKTLYEITPLEGLREKLGKDVNITVMRAASSELAPIADDYIQTRHWTGTPTWNVQAFKDKARTAKAGDGFVIPSSQYEVSGGKTEYVTFKSEVKPLQTGIHTLKVKAAGEFTLLVDGKTVLTHASDGLSSRSKKMEFKASKVYAFEIRYNGDQEFTLGWDAPGELFNSEEEYVAAARKADAVFFFGGLSHADDRESIDRRDLKMPGIQDEVIENLLKANANTVIFLLGGSPVEMPWEREASSILWGWYGGMEAGRAYADVLFGDVNPSGKLPMTFPVRLSDTAPIALNDYNATVAHYPEGVFIGYRWFDQRGIEPLFPFGHGLSYTTFGLSKLNVKKAKGKTGGLYTVTATVKNTGKVAGAEVVQLYLQDLEASVERPEKELKGFEKVFLKPGESKQVTMTLTKRDLSFWDEKTNNWLAEPGRFRVRLGTSVQAIHLEKDFTY